MADVDGLRCFLAVYRGGSVTRAAAALHVSQPAVSMQLRRFEQSLGTVLFDRGARGMSPTAAAHELARRASGPLAALDAAIAHSGPPEGIAELSGTVRLGGPADLLSSCVLPALSPLVSMRLRIHVTMSLADELLAGLRDGALDVVVSVVKPTGADLEFEPLYDETFVLVAAPRWARPGRATAASLASVPLLAFGPELPIIRRYWRLVFRARLGRTASVVAPDLRALRDAAIAGAGMSVLPTYLCRDALSSGQLVQLARAPVPVLNSIYLCWRRDERQSERGHTARIDAVRGTLLAAAREW